MTVAVTRRRSKYALAVKVSLEHFGHATNAQLADDLRRSYPHLSDTTIHRITQRLEEDGDIALAPNAIDGSIVYDSNTDPHDHFRCSACQRMSDINIPAACRKMMLVSTGPCLIDGAILVTGVCVHCIDRSQNNSTKRRSK